MLHLRLLTQNFLTLSFYYCGLSDLSLIDIYARFHSLGSARESFDYQNMEDVKIPLPPIEVQRSIVNIYRCAEEAKRIAEDADRLSREICPALMQHIIHEAGTKEW